MTLFYLKRALIIAFFIAAAVFCVLSALAIHPSILVVVRDFLPEGFLETYKLMLYVAVLSTFFLAAELLEFRISPKEQNKLARLGRYVLVWTGSLLLAFAAGFIFFGQILYVPDLCKQGFCGLPHLGLTISNLRRWHEVILLIPSSLFCLLAYMSFKEAKNRLQNIHVIEKNKDKRQKPG